MKGYFADQKNRRGRQLGRVLATHYDEIVVEQLYDGTCQLDASLPRLLSEAEQVLGLQAATAEVERARQNTVFRVDAAPPRRGVRGGTDDDINLLLGRGYHVFIKLKHWKRAQKLARSVGQWHPDSKVAGREVGWVQQPHDYVHPTRQKWPF